MGGPEADERAQPTPGKRKEDWQGHPPVLVPVERTHGGDPPAVTFQLWHGVEKPGLSLLSTHVPSFLRRRYDRRRFPFGAGVPPTKSFALETKPAGRSVTEKCAESQSFRGVGTFARTRVSTLG